MQNIESTTLTTSHFVQIAQNKYFSICTNSVPFEPPGMTKTNFQHQCNSKRKEYLIQKISPRG